MKIAVPLANGSFCPHFGGADTFALYQTDETTCAITATVLARPPAHERGAFPMWLSSQGVKTVLAGGMGVRAITMFNAYGIEVVTGATGHDPRELVTAYLEGRLTTSGEPCRGGGLHDCDGHAHRHGDGHGPEPRT